MRKTIGCTSVVRHIFRAAGLPLCMLFDVDSGCVGACSIGGLKCGCACDCKDQSGLVLDHFGMPSFTFDFVIRLANFADFEPM